MRRTELHRRAELCLLRARAVQSSQDKITLTIMANTLEWLANRDGAEDMELRERLERVIAMMEPPHHTRPRS